MKEGKSLVREAISDAKELRAAALESAKQMIIEEMTPGIRTLVEKALAGRLESVDRVNAQGSDYYSPATREKQKKWEEGTDMGDRPMKKDKEKKELDMESLAGMFPQLAEDPDADPDEAVHLEDADPDADPDEAMRFEDADPDADPDEAMSMGIPTLEDADPEEHEEEEMPDMKAHKEGVDEEIELSEAELRKFYESAQRAARIAEVEVKKGFGEQTPAGELDDVSKDVSKLIGGDVEKGEKPWEDVEPTAHQDYQVKESVRTLIQKGLIENRQLRANNAKLVKLVEHLGGKLHEVNLFNAKVLHVNKILNNHGRLTKEQKQVVLESIDRAKSIDEVKMVYTTIVKSFKAASPLSESVSRKPAANAQRARSSGAADPKVIRESADKGGAPFARMQQLAGLVK